MTVIQYRQGLKNEFFQVSIPEMPRLCWFYAKRTCIEYYRAILNDREKNLKKHFFLELKVDNLV